MKRPRGNGKQEASGNVSSVMFVLQEESEEINNAEQVKQLSQEEKKTVTELKNKNCDFL